MIMMLVMLILIMVDGDSGSCVCADLFYVVNVFPAMSTCHLLVSVFHFPFRT